MPYALPTPEPPSDIGAPSASREDRYREDRVLRQHGFSIHRRRAGLPVLWQRGGKFYTQEAALELARLKIAT